MTARQIEDLVLELLPADGRAVLVDQLIDAARVAGVRERAAWGALAALCTQQRAATEARGDYSFVRRRGADEADFPLRPRPLRRALRRVVVNR